MMPDCGYFAGMDTQNGQVPTEDVPIPPSDDDMLVELEKAVRAILRNRKTKAADRLSAINAGTKLLAIKHKIEGGDDKTGFFG
jgi:hypothetical protein